MCHIHIKKWEKERKRERNINSQKWFYYSVKWTTPITKADEKIYNISFIFTTNWPKYKKENQKKQENGFQGIRCIAKNYWVAVALLTSNLCITSIGFCGCVRMCVCVCVFCECLSVCMFVCYGAIHLAFELNCDSFLTILSSMYLLHYVYIYIYIYFVLMCVFSCLAFVFYPFTFTFTFTCWCWCKLTMSLFPFDMGHFCYTI